MKALFLFIFITLTVCAPLYAQDSVPYSRSNSRPMIRSDKEEAITGFNGQSTQLHIPDKFVRKRNTGIGLTIAGAGMLATGIALYATAPRRTVYTGYGQTQQYTTVAGVIGVLMIPASIGLTIPGAVLWGKYARKINRQRDR